LFDADAQRLGQQRLMVDALAKATPAPSRPAEKFIYAFRSAHKVSRTTRSSGKFTPAKGNITLRPLSEGDRAPDQGANHSYDTNNTTNC
jgi:hypothetical protein